MQTLFAFVINMKELIRFLSSESNSELIKSIESEYPLSMNRLEYYTKTFSDLPIKEFLTLLRLRKKVEKRIPDAHKLVFTEKGAMQSSSTVLAQYHAELLEEYNTIADLCCGCGIDLIAIAKGKSLCYAVDLDENTLACAVYNCSIHALDKVSFLQTKSEEFNRSVDAIFADPDRRPGNSRKHSADSISPSLNELLKLRALTPNMAIKLSPIMDYKSLELPKDSTLMFVSESGTMKEILLTTGELSREGVDRVAIQLPEKREYIRNEKLVSVTDISKYLYEPDPAIIRGGMVQDLAFQEEMTLIDSHLAITTSEESKTSSWYKTFKVLKIMSYNRKQLQKYLTANHIGDLTIKPRGFPEETEKFKKKLKLKGNNKATCFILRIGTGHTLVFVERVN